MTQVKKGENLFDLSLKQMSIRLMYTMQTSKHVLLEPTDYYKTDHTY